MSIALLALVMMLAVACSSKSATPVEPGAEDTSGRFVMLAGDVMLGRGIDQILPNSVDPILYEDYVRSAETYVAIAEEESGPIPRKVAPSYVWGDALPARAKYQPLAHIVNLETAVTTSDDPWPGKGIHYRMHPGNVNVLTAAHVDVAVLANNHVLDWERRGLLQTLQSLRDGGVRTAGAGEDLKIASAPAVVTTPAGRLLVFAMAHESSGVPPEWAAGPGRSGVNLVPDLSRRTAARVAAMIREHAGEPGDIVIASIHWGGNWGYRIPRDQEQFAKVLIDEGGVDIVHGHSSHHPKGIEVYQGRLILYGAGDLINDYEGIGGHQEFRPELTLLYLPNVDHSGRLLSMVMLPFRIRQFRLTQASNEEAAWLRDRVARKSPSASVELTADRAIVLRPRTAVSQRRIARRRPLLASRSSEM